MIYCGQIKEVHKKKEVAFNFFLIPYGVWFYEIVVIKRIFKKKIPYRIK